jgi:hypothetical protein
MTTTLSPPAAAALTPQQQQQHSREYLQVARHDGYVHYHR